MSMFDLCGGESESAGTGLRPISRAGSRRRLALGAVGLVGILAAGFGVRAADDATTTAGTTRAGVTAKGPEATRAEGVAAPEKGATNGLRWESAGVRLGYSLSSFSRPFIQSELFTTWNLPWTVRLGTNWALEPKLEVTAGGLTRHGESGFVGTVGPVLVLHSKSIPVFVEGGLRPTVISREVYGDRDLGYPLEFTSHLGLGWDISSRWSLSYRFQHTSNAGLGRSNPGLNMNLVGLGYRF